MAGGSFISFDKVRPGVYINFVSSPKPSRGIGDRGIATIAMPLSWGDTSLIDVYEEDFTTSDSLAKIGLSKYDDAAKVLVEMLSYCYIVKVYRLDTGGVKATVSDATDKFTITANYAGTFGNNITVSVSSLLNSLFEVKTFVNGSQKDSQIVATVAELDKNKFVTFSGDGPLSPNAGLQLKSGTDVPVIEETAWTDYLEILKTANFQVIGCMSSSTTTIAKVIDFVTKVRDDEGRFIQAVVSNTDADYEGIINSVSSCTIDNRVFTPLDFVGIVAALTAGAKVFDSNTGKIIKKATKIVPEMTNSQIIDGLKNGKFMLSPNYDGSIKVEQDINSLHTFTNSLGYSFSKNRVIRTLDEIGIGISNLWESSFLGKISNDANGRSLLRSSIVTYLYDLNVKSAIDNFDGAKDVEVLASAAIDAVICNIWVKPVDSMEKLYVTINVTN